MRISESRIKQIIREEAQRALRESEFDDFGGGETAEATIRDVVEMYKEEGPMIWMRVSNDFREMTDGGMEDVRREYYPGLDADDFRTIVRTLDRHFGTS